MSRKIVIPLPNFEFTEKTYLDADYSSGTALTVVNNYGFANDDIAIIGEPSEEKTESKDVTGQTGNQQIDISGALKFDHNKGNVIYRFEYDQYEIYRYRSATWTLISTSNIQWDKRETIYIDSGGLSTDSYRYRLKNSASVAYSDYSPTIAATGFTRSQVGYMIREVRKISGDTERKIVTDDEIIRQFNRAQEIIGAMRKDWWFLLVDTYKQNTPLTGVAGTNVYSLATFSDLEFISTMRVRYYDGSNTNTYHIEQIPKAELEYDHIDEDATDNDDVVAYTILPADSSSDQGYIRVSPTPQLTIVGATLKFFPDYYKKMADLDDVADETSVPIPSLLEDFALAYVYAVKGDETRTAMYEKRFYGPETGTEKYNASTGVRLLEKMQNGKNKAQGQPRSFRRHGGRRTYGNYSSSNRDYYHERYF